MDRSRLAAATLLLLALLSSLVVAQESAADTAPIPVTVAVDTSRSLRPGDLARTTDQIAATLALLPSDQPTGLLAFDDEPRWLVELGATPNDVTAALEALDPVGNYTQLHDALVVAARAMPEGGVILLATDGRDENSATTLEDVARVCESQGVRILPLAMGRSLQERTLRRLALLTGGEYLGSGEAGQMVEAISRSRDEIEQQQQEDTATIVVQPPATEPATPPVSRESTGSEGPAEERDTLPLPLILALVTILVLAAVLARLLGNLRQGPSESEAAHYCPRCGGAVPFEGATCPRCEEESLIARLQNRGIMELRQTAEFPVQPPSSLEDAFDPAVLEVTRVLADENMITIRTQGGDPRSYMLSSESAFAVGRDARSNSIGIPDTALSARHFKIVPEDGRYYVIDMGSTNGTYVNDEAVRSHLLKSGDVIRAGRTEFEYRSKARSLS